MDNSALGGDIVESSTENPSLEEDSGLIEDDGDDQSDGDLSETEEPQEPDGDETTDDSTLGNTDEGDTDSDEGTDDTENDTTSDELDTSALTEDQNQTVHGVCCGNISASFFIFHKSLHTECGRC